MLMLSAVAAPVFGAEMDADAINSAEPSRKTCRQFPSSDARTEDDWKRLRADVSSSMQAGHCFRRKVGHPFPGDLEMMLERCACIGS
jgi:hypothetical protein